MTCELVPLKKKKKKISARPRFATGDESSGRLPISDQLWANVHSHIDVILKAKTHFALICKL